MNDLDELSEKLFQHQKFSIHLKEVFTRFYQQKNEPIKSDEFIKPSIQNNSFNIKERSLEEDYDSSKQIPKSIGFNKIESRDSITSMNSNPFLSQYFSPQSTSNTTLAQITNQIAGLISEMVKRQTMSIYPKTVSTPVVVAPIDTNCISEIIQQMSEMQKQESARLKQIIQEKVSKLKAETQEQVISIVQKLKSEKKTKKNQIHALKVKNDRLKVTQSILQISKSNQQLSSFSNIHIHEVNRNILSDSDDDAGSEKVHSPEISMMSQKVNEIEKSQIKISKEFKTKFSQEVEKNSKDIQAMTERIIEWKLKNQQKMQDGFSGVWNVVTDIEEKLNKVSLKVAEVESALRGE